jgi:exodeoxyribonuclease VII small subunit
MSYEQVTKRLDEIVAALGSGTTTLTGSLELFEEGMRLLGEADAALASVEVRANELMQMPEVVATIASGERASSKPGEVGRAN